MFATDDEWLALSAEPALDPDLPIVDAHHHLLDAPEPATYDAQRFTSDAQRGHRIVGSVYAECGVAYRGEGPEVFRPVGETEYAVQIGHRIALAGGPPLLGIVAHADLRETATLAAVLDAHEAAGEGLFRGIRHSASHDPTGSIKVIAAGMAPAGLLADRAYRTGVRLLAERALTYDCWLYYHQLGQLAELARDVSEATVVLNHIGGPVGVAAYSGRRDEILAEWADGISELAECPNVVVKLGGIAMPLMGMKWHNRERPPSSVEVVEAWGAPVRHVLDRFGASRCMFESNFPVDRSSVGYDVLWNAFKKMSAHLDAAERQAVFSGTATRVYNLHRTDEGAPS